MQGSGIKFVMAIAAVLASASAASSQEVVLGGLMDGSQEVPPVGTAATGDASFVIDTQANTLTFFIDYQNLSSAETAAHIHGPAAPGSNGPVLFTLQLGPQKIGVWNYPQSSEADILAGLTYVNVHTSMNPGGEIRGQIVVGKSPTLVLVGHMDGAQEVPPVVTMATGRTAMFVDTANNELAFYVEHQNLSSQQIAAHIHGPAAPGSNAGVLNPIPIGSPSTGVWNYAQSLESDILAGLTYTNIHTISHSFGEIRGQNVLLGNPDVYCQAKPNSQGCLPAIGSSGSPTLTGPDDFFATATMELNFRNGLFFFGFGPANLPFFKGTLCVQPPLKRTSIQNSAGSPPPMVDCSGAYSFHFSQALMVSTGIQAGDLVYGQYWSRDPANSDGTGVALSDAMVITVGP